MYSPEQKAGWLAHPLRRHAALPQAQSRHQLRAAELLQLLLLRVGVHLLPLLHLLLLLLLHLLLVLQLQLLQEHGVDARRQARHARRLQ